MDNAFAFCNKALEQNSSYANAMVNMGLVYKEKRQVEDATKWFQSALDNEPHNIPAIVNMGCMQYEEFQHFEDAAILFLDALEINPADEEALCNLALALKRTTYLDYAQMAFEEAVNVSPGNTFILTNYMMFLLEQKDFGQFDRVLPHAKLVMAEYELDQITGLHQEFKEAIVGKNGQDGEGVSGPSSGQGGPKSFSALRGALKDIQRAAAQGFGGRGAQMQPIAEEGEEQV